MEQLKKIDYLDLKKLCFAGAIVSLCLFYAVFITIIPPGHVGVIVNLLGENKGVDEKELTVGMHFIPPHKKIYKFPISEQNTAWEDESKEFHFQTREGMAVSAAFGITYSLEPSSVPLIFQKYRKGMDEITNIFIRNFIRDAINKAASKTSIEDLYSGKQTFFEDLEHHVRQDFAPLGIKLTRIYLIGRFHFPPNVIAALNAKIEASQRAQQRENELREAEAEARKQIAKAEGHAKCVLLQAEAEAKANLTLAQSITPDLIKWQSVQKWDGKLPQVSSDCTPLINLK